MSAPVYATLNLTAVQPLIGDSLRTALAAHGLVICERLSGPEVLGEILAPIDEERATRLFDEAGRNAAGMLAFNAEL